MPEISEPTEKDFEIVRQKNEPIYEIVKRDWELQEEDNGALFDFEE